jgi:ubiquinone/menaquinone biosynthesis C-methylase UbiE
MVTDPFGPLAARYDGWFETPLGQAVDEVEQRAFFAMAKIQPGERVLEVGCGTGHYLQVLAARGARVSGIDISRPMLAVTLAKKIPGAGLARASAAALPFPDGAFDVVVAITVLEFLPDVGAAMAEMRRVLCPGGRLLVAVLNRHSLWYWLYWRRRGVYAQAHLFTPGEFRRLLTAVGWSYPEIRPALFFPPWKWAPGAGLATLWEAVGRRLWPGWGAFLVGRAIKSSLMAIP